MGPRVEFEDIEGMRREAGIDDGELREQVRRLRAGDSVRLTAAAGGEPGLRDRLLVRITNIRGTVFRGSLVPPGGASHQEVKVRSTFSFRAAHIHSIVHNARAGTSTPAVGQSRPHGKGTTMIAHPNGHRPKSAARRSASLITVETRLKEIEELLVRVTGYSEFMCSGAGLEGTSKEARDQAIIDFHERMVSMERHLARVHDEFRLG